VPSAILLLTPRDRQLEGIAKAKAAGVYKGRPLSIDGRGIVITRLGPLRAVGDPFNNGQPSGRIEFQL
jgi:DNA invertase Pin-like site-specific DNA recombinase